MDFGLHAVCLSKTTMTGLEFLLSLFLFGVFVFLFLVNPVIRNTISLNISIGNPAECPGKIDLLNIYIFSVNSVSFQVYSIK